LRRLIRSGKTVKYTERFEKTGKVEEEKEDQGERFQKTLQGETRKIWKTNKKGLRRLARFEKMDENEEQRCENTGKVLEDG